MLIGEIVDYYVFRMRGKQAPEFDMFEQAEPVHWLACVAVVLGGVTAYQLAKMGSIFGAASVTSFVFGGPFYFLPKVLIRANAK